MEQLLQNKKIAILATNGVDQRELTNVRKLLIDSGASTSLISLSTDDITMWGEDHNWGEKTHVDMSIENAKVEDYDALFLPGGLFNPDKLRTSVQVIRFVKEMYQSGKPIAAICHAPWLLVSAGIVRGKRVTSYPSLKVDLENAGATWVDEQVVVDGKIVTSRRPDDIEAFSQQVISLFSE